ALDRLVDVALLDETSYGQYVPHDLVRDFARELAGTADAAEAVEQALRWYAARARQSLLVLLPPGYERDERLRTTGAAAEPPPTEEPFASAEEAFAWGDRELPNIVALVERGGGPAAALVPALVRHLFPYLHRGGRLAELDVLGRLALNAARSLGDAEAEAFALTDRAGLHFMSGRASEALALNDEGLTLWRRLGVVSCVRRCLNNRGLVLESLGRYEESEETLRQSLELSRQLGDPYGEAVTFSHLGNLYKHTDARAAIAHHERSLALGELADSLVVRHTAHCNIGYAHLRLGEPAAAVRNFEQSLLILGDDEDWQGESKSRLGLVRALRELGRPDRASHE
ncbi:tetratricopeptide repeat protein, partial [Streptomyces sp. ND04-05B]|uniref:tetratricopeptide repeat protein n=1 Tax=Streptomyces sp. ND04-05B TaxID=3028693 RepID=UPI0029ADD7DE